MIEQTKLRTATAEAMADAAEAFRALDYSAENAQIAAYNAEADRLAAAINRADNRIAEIHHDLSQARKVDGGAVAAALLQGETATMAAALGPNREALEAERESLQAGRRELADKDREVRAAREAFKAESRGKPIEAARPWVDAVMADAIDAAERLLHAYASLSAIHSAAPGFAPELDRLGYAAEGVSGTGRLLSWRRSIDVPEATRQALAPLTGKAIGAPVSIPTAVGLPAKTTDRLDVLGLDMIRAG